MKTKLLYVGLSILVLGSLLFVGLIINSKQPSLADLDGEIKLISNEVDENQDYDIDPVIYNLFLEIGQQKDLLDSHLSSIEASKMYIESNDIELSRRDLIYIKLSLVEIRAYKGLYIDTFNSIKDEFSALEVPYEQLTLEQQAEFVQFVTDVLTYRLVLLEKVNLELVNIINIVEIYEGEN
ncbi:MAG: hypothetical protein K8Q99_02705 [Acholeplasmataceae bacterium]|nr:hypothetical protein [Acholeplasmataceae bacterium]